MFKFYTQGSAKPPPGEPVGFTAKRLQNSAQECVGFTAKRLGNLAQALARLWPGLATPQR
jgi:hypothetical protein